MLSRPLDLHPERTLRVEVRSGHALGDQRGGSGSSSGRDGAERRPQRPGGSDHSERTERSGRRSARPRRSQLLGRRRSPRALRTVRRSERPDRVDRSGKHSCDAPACCRGLSWTRRREALDARYGRCQLCGASSARAMAALLEEWSHGMPYAHSRRADQGMLRFAVRLRSAALVAVLELFGDRRCAGSPTIAKAFSGLIFLGCA